MGSGGCCCNVDVGTVSSPSDTSPSSDAMSVGGASLGRGGWSNGSLSSSAIVVGALVAIVTREGASSGSLDRLRLLLAGLAMIDERKCGIWIELSCGGC